MEKGPSDIKEEGCGERGRVLPYCPVYLDDSQCFMFNNGPQELTVTVKTTRRTIPADLAIYVRISFSKADLCSKIYKPACRKAYG